MKDRHAQETDQYATNGYTIFRDVLPRYLVDEALQHIDWLRRHNPGLRPEQLGHALVRDDAFWLRLISDERLLDIAASFIGRDIALFASHYIAKPPYEGQKVLWHQDGTYWPLDPMDVVTLWLALDDVDVENGCMRVVPGTQNQRLLAYEELEQHQDDDNVLGSGISPDMVDESTAVDVTLRAGDVSVHDPKVIHGSNANTSARWRRGLTIRYIPATTRIVTDGQWVSAFMLRGEAVAGRNRYLPFPKFDEARHMSFSDVKAYNEQCTLRNDRYATHINWSF